MPKPQSLGALLTASDLLNLYTNVYPDWTKMTELSAKSHIPIYGHSHEI